MDVGFLGSVPWTSRMTLGSLPSPGCRIDVKMDFENL
jgi:hypothetical protein